MVTPTIDMLSGDSREEDAQAVDSRSTMVSNAAAQEEPLLFQ
jgi:hypothetical protein